MSIKVTGSNIGGGVWRANKALISLQQAALTRKSDFLGECLNNFANACSLGIILVKKALQTFQLKAVNTIRETMSQNTVNLSGFKLYMSLLP